MQEKSSYAQVLRKLGKQVNEAKARIKKNQVNPNYELAKVYLFLGEKQNALNKLCK
jgi:hypothetical protein